MIYKNLININNTQKKIFLFFCYVILYYVSSTYMYGEHDPYLLATGYDAGRYLNNENFFSGKVSGLETAWHLYFTYTLFIRILESINLIDHYVEVQCI